MKAEKIKFDKTLKIPVRNLRKIHINDDQNEKRNTKIFPTLLRLTYSMLGFKIYNRFIIRTL